VDGTYRDGALIAEEIRDTQTDATFSPKRIRLQKGRAEEVGRISDVFDLSLPGDDPIRGYAFDITLEEGQMSPTGKSKVSVVFLGRRCSGPIENGHAAKVIGWYDQNWVLHADTVEDTTANTNPHRLYRLKKFHVWSFLFSALILLAFAFPWVIVLGISSSFVEEPPFTAFQLSWTPLTFIAAVFSLVKFFRRWRNHGLVK